MPQCSVDGPEQQVSFSQMDGPALKSKFLGAISLGGDTDTIGAMAGAISGAYLGVDAIPGRWQGKLENRRYIAELAESLCNI